MFKTFKQVQVRTPCCLLKDPGIKKTLEMAVEETGSTKSSENKTAQDRSGHTQIIYRKKLLVETEIGICSVVLASFEVGLEKTQTGFNYYFFREES